jgi:branched-chain amino acid transport system substrate-binding protein
MRVRAVVASVGALALMLASCGGSKSEPVGIGILSDCYGPFSSVHELNVASAELPLIERGGTLRGRNPSDGIDGPTVAGRRVELLVGCVTGSEDLLPEARRLVEESGADVLIGPLYPHHGLVVRDYARQRRETTFLIQPSNAPEVTLDRPPPNVFRFVPTTAQTAAGLGAYAYYKLGWRTAATVGDDTPYGWGSIAGFVAEFCALGGRVVDRTWTTPGAPTAGLAAQLPSSVDGVYVGGTISPMGDFVQRYARTHPDLATRLLADATLFYDPQVVASAPGLVAGGALPFQPTKAAQAYAASFAEAFPAIPATAALSPLALPYRNGVEAVLMALERSNGATGSTLMGELAQLEVDSPTGRIRLDDQRQAVVPNYLSQVARKRGAPPITTLRVIPNVEQTFGGYFEPGGPPTSRTTPACRKGNPPPWATR